MCNQSVRLLVIVVLLGGLGASAYFLYRYLNPPPVAATPPKPSPAVSRDAIAVPPVRFTDITKEAGIHFQHFQGLSGKKLLPETMGSGVAFIDFDNDGFQDILFVNSCPWPGQPAGDAVPTMALYRNKGDGTFEDVTEKMGLNVPIYGLGVTVGDYDNDDYPDIFISAVGKNRLFHNEKGKMFREVTDEAGVGGPGKLPSVARELFLEWKEPIPFGTSCTFLDYDGDGKLDLFVCHYVAWSPKIDQSVGSSLTGGRRDYVQPKDFDGSNCVLYRNKGDGTFEDVSKKVGIRVEDKDGIGEKDRARAVGKSLGVIVCDADGDGWPDIIVANDTVRNFFFHNIAGPDGTRRYEEIGFRIGAAYADEGKPRGGMGIDWGEFAPKRFGAVIANFANEPSTLLSLENPKPLRFTDSALSACLAGPSRGPLKFGTFFFDYDLDGRLDLLTCNGHIEPEIATIQGGQTYAQPVQLFWNTGQADRIFEEVTPAAAGNDLFKPMVGRGSAFGDIDNNGTLDVVLAANGGPARLLRNDYKGGNHWIRLHLKGDGVHSNKSAIGAQVEIEAGGQILHRQISAGRGYLSQSELPLTVGLGSATKVDRVTVRWPGRDLKPETWTNLDVDKKYELKQGEAGK